MDIVQLGHDILKLETELEQNGLDKRQIERKLKSRYFNLYQRMITEVKESIPPSKRSIVYYPYGGRDLSYAKLGGLFLLEDDYFVHSNVKVSRVRSKIWKDNKRRNKKYIKYLKSKRILKEDAQIQTIRADSNSSPLLVNDTRTTLVYKPGVSTDKIHKMLERGGYEHTIENETSLGFLEKYREKDLKFGAIVIAGYLKLLEDFLGERGYKLVKRIQNKIKYPVIIPQHHIFPKELCVFVKDDSYPQMINPMY